MAGMGSNQDEHKLLRDARGDKKGSLKQTGGVQTGQDKRPPGMPGMMPPGTMEPRADDPPDFGEDDEEYHKVNAQTDLDEAMEVEKVDEDEPNLGEGKEDADVDQDKSDNDSEEEDEDMDAGTPQTGQTASISPTTTARVNEQILGILEPALVSLVSVRGDEDKRMKDTNPMREASVNRTEGSIMVTITKREKNSAKMGRMIGTLHRMEGIKLKGQLYVEGGPDCTDVILEIDNAVVGKLLEKALSDDMNKTILPKSATGARLRSTKGIRTKGMEGLTGSGSSADKDKLVMKQDKLSQLIEMGDEEAILKLLHGWNYSMEMEKLTDFL